MSRKLPCTAAVLFAAAVPLNAAQAGQHEENMARIGKGYAVTFSSVDDCLAKGFKQDVCKKSEETTQSPDFYVSFNLRSDCENKALVCTQKAGSTQSFNPVTGVPSRSQIMITYVPERIGWAALASDLNVSAPLFKSTIPGAGVMANGWTIGLQQR